MILIIQILGVLLLGLALLHTIFPRYFRWQEELASLSLVNREMMKIHTLFIAVTVGLMGFLCLSSAELLVTTELGRRIQAGFAIFWGLRLLIQFVGYSAALWRGKPFETTLHVLFSLLWVTLTAVFTLGAMA